MKGGLTMLKEYTKLTAEQQEVMKEEFPEDYEERKYWMSGLNLIMTTIEVEI